MKPKTIIVMSVLLVVVIAWVAGRQLFQSKPPEAAGPEAKAIFDPAVEDVTQVMIQPAAAPKIVMAKRDGQWRLTEPVKARASELRINDVVRTVQKVKSVRSIAAGDKQLSDQQAGLDKPAFVVTLANSAGKSQTLRIGNPVPFESPVKTYVRAEGKPDTLVADADFSHVLYAAANDYRDKTVLSVPTEQAVRVSVVGQQSFELAKIDGHWSLVKPVSARAVEDKVTSLLGRLAAVTTERFVSDSPANLSQYELEPGKEQAVVRVWTQPPAPATSATGPAAASVPAPKEMGIAIGKEVDGKVYAKVLDEPTVFMLEASLAKDLQPEAKDLRDKKVLAFNTADVTAVELTVAGGSARLAKDGMAWKLAKPVAGPASEAAVSKLLTALSGLEAVDFPQSVQALGVYGLDAPKAKITLELSGRSETIGVLVGATSRTGEMTFVMPEASKAVAVVKSSDVQALLAEPAGYYDTRLLSLDETAIRRVHAARKDGTFVAVPEGAKWKLIAPEPAAADEGSIAAILGQLGSLQATKIVALGTPVADKYAKADGKITLTITTEMPAPKPAATTATAPATAATSTSPATGAAPASTEPTTKSTVLHVVKIDTHAYAWVDGQPNTPVGEFPASLYDTMTAELRSREVLSFEQADISGVKIVSAKETVELKRADGKWALASDPYVKIDAAKVTAYLGELHGLKAERFLSTKSEDADKHGLKDPALRVELTTAAGKTLTLAAAKGGEKATSRAAISSDAKGVFELPASTVDRLIKTWKDFQQADTPAPTPAPGGMPMPMPGGMPMPMD